jgi:hypothetical protein
MRKLFVLVSIVGPLLIMHHRHGPFISLFGFSHPRCFFVQFLFCYQQYNGITVPKSHSHSFFCQQNVTIATVKTLYMHTGTAYLDDITYIKRTFGRRQSLLTFSVCA